MHVPVERRQVPADKTTQPGSDSTNNGGGSSPIAVIIPVVILVVALLLSLLYLTLRWLRARDASPRLLPGAWLKRKWKSWTSAHENQRGKYLPTPHLTRIDHRQSRETLTATMSRLSPLDTAAAPPTPPPPSLADDAARDVDRHTSVRSIMTLPSYLPSPRPTETILGRAGERAGIDTVIEFPETADEEEVRREAEMQSLYQIRAARRREQAAREERRRQRQDAIDSGDWDRVRELRRLDRTRRALEQERERAGAAVTDIIPHGDESEEFAARDLVAQHRAAMRERERRISSVSYASLGVARHDGTRLRADSAESDRRPLLDNAAAMTHTRAGSGLTLEMTASRARSASVDSGSNVSDEEAEPLQRRFRAHSRAASGLSGSTASASNLRAEVRQSEEREREQQQQQVEDADEAAAPPEYEGLGIGWEEETRGSGSGVAGSAEAEARQGTQLPRPEEGEEAPPYESPVRTGVPRLPAMARLPAIDVTLASPGVEG